MARPHSSVGAIGAFTGMVALITGVSVYPRLTLTNDDNFTTLRYEHRQSTSSGVPPSDPGLVIAPSPKSQIMSSSDNDPKVSTTGRPWRDRDWILDTGATTHVCTDASVMHGYTTFNHSPLMRSVGHFGPNPIQIAGMGDCTLDLPGNSHARLGVSGALGIERGYSAKGRLTIHNVSHIPTAGINIISWSQLRRARGLELRLRDNEDGSLGVVQWARGEGKEIMRFVNRDGLYFLDRGNDN